MYGFGDDRNPSNDTVNVMEEILIEYITDVVGDLLCHVGMKH
jgi:transcription initiation factor TFIID subunit 13